MILCVHESKHTLFHRWIPLYHIQSSIQRFMEQISFYLAIFNIIRIDLPNSQIYLLFDILNMIRSGPLRDAFYQID